MASTLGVTTVLSSVDNNDPNTLVVSGPYTVGSDTKIQNGQAFQISGGTGSQKVRMVVYGDSGDGKTPATVPLGASDEVNIPASTGGQWVTFPFSTSVALSAGTKVWIGLWWGPDVSSYDFFVSSGAGATQYYNLSVPYTSTGLPASKPWTANTDGQAYSTYFNMTSAPVDAGHVATSVVTGVRPWTVTLPSGIVAGDLLVVVGRGGGAITTLLPSGWNWLDQNDSSDASDDTVSVIWKWADGSEGSSLSWDMGFAIKGGAIAWRITGALNHAPEIASAVFLTTANTADPPTITPSAGSKDYLFLVAATKDGVGATTAAPSGYTNLVTGASSGGGAATNATVAGASRQATTASENPGVFTHAAATTGGLVFTIAVSPAVAAAAQTVPVPSVYPPGITPTIVSTFLVEDGHVVDGTRVSQFGSVTIHYSFPQRIQVGGVYPPGFQPSITGKVTSGDGHVALGVPGTQFGQVTTRQPTQGPGLPSEQAFGQVTIRASVAKGLGGVNSAQAFGAPTVQGALTLGVSGLSSEQAFGAPNILASIRLQLAGLSSEQAFGEITAVRAAVHIPVSGVQSAQAFGQVNPVYVVRPAGGVPSAQAFGTLSFYTTVTIEVLGLESEQAFGTQTLAVFNVYLHPLDCLEQELAELACLESELDELDCRISGIAVICDETTICGTELCGGEPSFNAENECIDSPVAPPIVNQFLVDQRLVGGTSFTHPVTFIRTVDLEPAGSL